MKAFAAKCLTSINARGCKNLSDEALKTIAANCPSLTLLNVGGCWHLTDEGFKAIAVNCPALTDVSMAESFVTDEAVKAIAANCPPLSALDVLVCKAIAVNCLRSRSLARPSAASPSRPSP